MKRILFAFALLAGTCAIDVAAQNVIDPIHEGDEAAAADRHEEAIAAYQQALRQRPALRTELAAKLGRQYLWADRKAEAVQWLREYVTAHPGDCDVRFDYALALSWNGQLLAALREYRMLADACPGRKQQARLRIAQIYRWQDRPGAAESLYKKVLAEGSEDERRDARVALGFVEIDKDQNRRAIRVFTSEAARGHSPSLDEGAAIAAVRIGDSDAVASILDRAATSGQSSRDLLELRREWELRDRMWLTPRNNAFRDADGTTYVGAELGGSVGWLRRGRVEAAVGRSTLEREGDSIDDQWVAGRVDHRFSPAFAMAAAARIHDFDAIGFQPLTGEVNLVLTPSDGTRLDASAARIIIADNHAALRQQLEGTFFGLGVDQRLGFRTTVAASADVTRWNTDNERQRFRFNIIHRFEGTPRVTLEWPSLYQQYDEPFAFNLFSPRRYVETGPAINVYRRFARVWNVTAYLRGGVQQEDSLGWKQLATVRVSLERDLHDVWAAGAAFTWTNSNLASATGFRRTAGTLTLTRRF